MFEFMSAADYERWSSATTLQQVAQLTALWLEGSIDSQPGYMPESGPAEETTDGGLVPVLARCNRAGWLTDCSQPGLSIAEGDQRAGVEGFTTPDLADVLAAAALDAGLVVHLHDGTGWSGRNEYTAVTRDEQGRIFTGLGRRRSRRELNFQYSEVSRSARREIRAAQQLTIIDPEWGRKDLLWTTLETALDEFDRTRAVLTSADTDERGGNR
ncbi:hypothetical protein D5S17_29020 [Pseudonocardiaceae bacterium YIM PH 21723]|nr:hypothetical protein D5S17_29020 [Pseudonocardiaceae bacterium YIM PH 21723]